MLNITPKTLQNLKGSEYDFEPFCIKTWTPLSDKTQNYCWFLVHSDWSTYWSF